MGLKYKLEQSGHDTDMESRGFAPITPSSFYRLVYVSLTKRRTISFTNDVFPASSVCGD